MKLSTESATRLTQWGNSLLNKLSAPARNRRKRDASKRRRANGYNVLRDENSTTF